ncbi:hypothetical protein [Ekhidna sp.]|jgi:hypothetical protein|uniref:hypothetical protein n=1 Tax=Ekhidna sp. TaxID=2608089 RepID=UPI0032EBFE9F|tara:strand:+ start:515 stop:1312 length:798 start_codon:yes stop_codon:yes gene_type:complete
MDQVTEEQRRKEHFHNHALKGDLEEIGAIPLAHDQAENNPHNEKSERKKNERYAELLHTITQAQEAYDALMERLNAELNALRTVIKELETEMEQNRDEWDLNSEILNDIDDVFCNFEDGGNMDRDAAYAAFQKAGIEVSHDATDVEVIAHLHDVREKTIQKVDDLDTAFLIMEADHKNFRAREDQVLATKQQLEIIGKDSSLSDEAKVTAIRALDQEVGSKTLHRSATIVNDEEVAAKADEVIEENKIDQHAKTTISVSNFPGLN